MSGLMNISKPTLFVDTERVKRNIRRMTGKAKSSGVRFRPHFKTHQSIYIGELYKEMGINAICVSSVDMAEYFADAGWDDITLLVPVNWLQIDSINALAQRIKLSLHVESAATAAFLAAHLKHPADIWIEIDTGKRRTGIWWEDSATIAQVAAAVCQPFMTLRGILTFAGQSYGARSRDEAVQIYDSTAAIMASIRSNLAERGFTGLEISVGDTPSCSIKEALTGIDEVRAGTLVFYDVMQMSLGACGEDDIAITVGCPVIAKYPDRSELTIYGGAVHFSRDSLKLPDGTVIYGLVTTFKDTGWNRVEADCIVTDLSQEIGTVRLSREFFDEVNVGDVIAVLPVHACLTVNEMGAFTTLDGQIHRIMPRHNDAAFLD
jgi:D-serine deaminase-like pyridoxal phosphate-dependent protein